MNRILAIGHTDIRLFLKRKFAYVWLFVAPFIFIYIFGAANRAPGDPENREPRARIENADAGFLGGILSDQLGRGLRTVKNGNAGQAAAIILIPPDFTDKVLHHRHANVELRKGDNANEADDAIIQLHLARVMEAFDGEVRAAARPTGDQLTEERLRAVISAPQPVTLDARFAGRQPVPSGFNFSLPANLLMYLMMNLMIFGGSTLAAERGNGVIRRLLTNPVTSAQIVLGKIYGLMLLAAVQIVFFLVVGRFVLGVNLGANLPGVVVTLFVFAWVAASLGVLAGSLLAAGDRVVGICVLASLVMAALGGCWWPLEIAPPAARLAALFIPTGWALQALDQLISFGNGFAAVILPLAVLAGFATAASVLAARFFKS
jgi:ABC-2 type transport system permease protein